MMCPTGCLFPCVICRPSSCLLAAVSSVPLIRLAVRVVPMLSARLLVSFRRLAPSCLPIGYVRLVPSAHPACSRLAASLRSTCSPRLSCRRAGRSASRFHLVMRLAIISSCVPSAASACLPVVMRSARPLLGVLTVILNAVAMGTVGCGAFVPRFHKLHLLSMGVVRISSSARRPFFLLFRFLSSCLPVPRVDKRGDVWRFSR